MNNNKSIKALCLSVLLVVFMATAQAETFCVGEFYQSRVETDLIVQEGSTCIITAGINILGNLIVEEGGILEINAPFPLTIYGSLLAYAASNIDLRRVIVFGDVILDGSSKNGISERNVTVSLLTVLGDLEIDGYEIAMDEIKVQDSFIGRNLTIESNAIRSISLFLNQVGKNIIVKNNDAISRIQVEGNTAGNRIVCNGNIPVPHNSEQGEANFALKGVEGQCADLI